MLYLTVCSRWCVRYDFRLKKNPPAAQTIFKVSGFRFILLKTLCDTPVQKDSPVYKVATNQRTNWTECNDIGPEHATKSAGWNCSEVKNGSSYQRFSYVFSTANYYWSGRHATSGKTVN